MSHKPAHETDLRAQDTPAVGIPDQDPSVTGSARTRLNISWAISLFGTAVGAGILFLPINAGAGGPWPLLLVTLLIWPMTYLSHRALSRFVCVSPRKGEDITVVAGDYFGKAWGMAITLLYFLAIYPIVLIYGVGITNTVDSFIVNQLGGPELPRPLLAIVLIGLMMLVMVFGEKVMLRTAAILVYPLILLLLILSIYLIPQWDLSVFTESRPSVGAFFMSAWLIIPVLVFAFNHSPAISQFSLAMQRAYGRDAVQEASKTLRLTATLLVVFTMFFVWSCVLALGADGLAEAREQNLPVLSYIANVTNTPLVAWLAPLIAIAAIGSSFFGHYLGTAEGASGIVRQVLPGVANRLGTKGITIAVAAFIYITSVIVAIINPSILGVIESLGGPVIAAILYIMPIVAIYTVPALEKYRHRWFTNAFVVIMGLVAIGGIFFTFIR
ncbi:MAG: aromatic amino acid transport family protein [Dermabacter sp.]|nr:aromatic amino acid transport family protein [Dermabacter sp.]